MTIMSHLREIADHTFENVTKQILESGQRLIPAIISLDRELYLLMETRADDIVRDRAILPKYRKAVIVHVYVGLEATDQDTLDRLNKDASVDAGRESLKLIREHGMLSETSFVLGFPEEMISTAK